MTDLKLDKDGYLINLDDWNRDVAEQLASNAGIILTQDHWDIIYALQDYYREYQHAPSQRPLVKFIATKLGQEKGNSLFLMRLFSGSPALEAARIAGLPRPVNCF